MNNFCRFLTAALAAAVLGGCETIGRPAPAAGETSAPAATAPTAATPAPAPAAGTTPPEAAAKPTPVAETAPAQPPVQPEKTAAVAPELPKTQIHEGVEWLDIRFNSPNTSRPRVLLVGDSIVRGHAQEVAKRLAPGVVIDQLATSRCVSDEEFRKELDHVLNQQKYALIIFNNGLHGMKISDDVYAAHLEDTLKYLKTRSPKVVWRSTTSMRNPADPRKPAELDARVVQRNRRAQEIARSLDIPIIDFYALLNGREKFFAPDGVHYNAAGVQEQSRIISMAIDALLVQP